MIKIVALLPMKAHSERVPNKNIKLFGKKPLYHHILNTLLNCKNIDSVYIDTDSENIKQNINENFKENVFIINRPTNLCGDFVPMNDIIAYDIKQINADFYLQTHSTNPLLKSETIDCAITKFLENKDKHDSLFSVTKIQSRFWNSKTKPINHNPKQLLRTQDLEPIYEENSNIFLFSKETIIKCQNRIGNSPLLFEISKTEAIDIDDLDDFHIAETLYNYQKEKRLNKS